MRTVMMLAAAAALLPLGARADAAGNRSTTASLGVQKAPQGRTFQFAGDTDWFRVQLERGADYYVSVLCNCTFDIRDRAGRVLASGRAADWDSPSGFGFRAPYKGLYFVEARDFGDDPGVTYPTGYQATVSGDCASGADTRCAIIAPGRTWAGTLGDGRDDDAFRLPVQAGRSYTVSVAPGDPPPGDVEVSVLDPSGTSVGYGAAVTFTAASAGTYLLVVGTEDTHGGGAYSLSVSAAAARR